eukprot:gene9103-55468_t
MWLFDRSGGMGFNANYVMCTASGDGKVLLWEKPPEKHDGAPAALEGPAQGYTIRRKAGLAGGTARRRKGDSDSDDDDDSPMTKTTDPYRDLLLNRIGVQSICVLQSLRQTGGQMQVPFVDNPLVMGSEAGEVFKANMRLPPGATGLRKTIGEDALVSLQTTDGSMQQMEQHYGPSPVLAIAFNHANASSLATGDLWQLSQQISHPTRGETTLMSLSSFQEHKRKEQWERLTGLGF